MRLSETVGIRPLALFKSMKEPLLEPVNSSFKKFIDFYFDTSFLFVRMLLPSGPALLHEQDTVMTRVGIPAHLRAEYSMLHLQAGANLADVQTQYRELAKLYHPDVGGNHAYFIALQRAYERVVEYLQTGV